MLERKKCPSDSTSRRLVTVQRGFYKVVVAEAEVLSYGDDGWGETVQKAPDCGPRRGRAGSHGRGQIKD